ncbi:MAG: choice-of-anchor J domain-containing protein, partial [Bacteroidota bacterium]
MPGKLVYNIVLLSGLFLLPVFGNAQEVLLDVDFNDCELPADWAVDLQGNPDAAWYVGTPVNGNSDGSSIDGSCMLIIDDDATGEDTDPFDLTLWSPAFDGSGFTNLALQLDVHFRNYNGSDSLEILVRSGEAVERIQLFRDQSTGLQFSEFTTVTADLAFYATDQMQIGIHYADGGDWNWWAGVDNILVTGSGDGDNILLADFNDCTLPTGWLTEVVTGENDWQLGFLDNENTGVTSMNGSCFLYFDDDGLGEEAAFSTVRLATPEIDGSAGSEMILNVDLTFRTFQENESLVIGVYDVETERFSPVATYLSDVGGPEMDNYETQSIDLSAFRAQRMRIVFQYDDGDSWGWWIGMDNIKLTVRGELNELCTKAQPLEIATDTCVQASTTLALFDGPQPLCSAANVGSLWYTFNATQSGWVTATTQADFNDVITVLAGDCTDPQPVSCANRDEHGFTGETHYFQVTAGNDYYLRVSGQTSSFGRARGNLCLNLAYSTGPPAGPTNEACSAALALTVDEACVAGNNYWAQFPDPLPSRAALVRAGVWYQFTPSTTTPLIIRTTADFAHALTLFDGSCDNLIEVATNEYGDELLFSEVSAGTTYYLQVTGAFATVEGNLRASVTTTETTPENATCPTALNLPLNGECVFATNAGASFNGPAISCDPYLDASIWFQTTAP